MAFLALVVFWAAGRIDLVEKSFGFARKYEHWELDEIITLSLFFMFYFMVLALRKWRQAIKANHELQKANQELQEAAMEIKALRGIIPICANCKSIRDDQGYWQKVEQYIRDRADVRFTHGLCPECFVKLYPDLKLPEDARKQMDDSGQ